MIKKLLKRIIPKEYHPLYHLHTRTIRLSNGLIQKGPFSGMRYHDKSYSSGSCSKFNGTYEQEIQPIIENEINKEYDVFIDIGSADGYYSVGMALWSNCSKIISFDIFATLGPIKAEPIPANNIIDIALGAISFFTVSTAAKRY